MYSTRVRTLCTARTLFPPSRELLPLSPTTPPGGGAFGGSAADPPDCGHGSSARLRYILPCTYYRSTYLLVCSAPSGQVLGQSHRAVPVQYQYRCCHGETRGGGSGEIWILSLSAYLLLLLPLPSTCHCLLHITACYKSLPPHTHHCPPSHHLCPNPHPSPRPCALGHVLLPLAASRDTSGPVWHRLLAAVRRTRRNSVS